MKECAGIAQLVEHQPSKLRVASSNLVSRSNHDDGRGEDERMLELTRVVSRERVRPDGDSCLNRCAHVAQSVEHFLGKEEVTGSNPVMGSITSVG